MATKAKITTRTTTKTSTRQASTAPKGPKGRQAKPTPEPSAPTIARCLVPNCPRGVVRRGLCHPCAAEAGTLVRHGLTTWERLEAEGKAQPLVREREPDVPHRKSWFLGHWTPEGGFLVVETPPPAPEEV